MTLVLNAVLYQAGWLACLYGAANGMPWIGIGVALAVIAWHLGWAPRAVPELKLLLVAAACGAALETTLAAVGLVRFPAGSWPPGMAPAWMIALWALFATTLNVSLRGLRSRPALAALLGAAGAPLAYYAGARLGALELHSHAAALGAIAILWAAATPALLHVARRLDGYARP